MAKFKETTYLESAPRVDAENGILYGVKVLGENSKNKRRYAGKGMKNAAPKYEGIKSYIDHPDREHLSGDRKFGDWSGVFKNPRYEEGKGIFADLHLRKSGDHFEGIIEAALKFPSSVGFSHVAEGDSHYDNDTEIVESWNPFSVDLVTDPATTAGIFESHKRESESIAKVKTLLESLPECPQRKTLIEMMGEYGISDMSMGEENKPTDPYAQVIALCEKLVEMLGEALIASKTPPPPTVPPPAAPNAPNAPNGQEDEEMSDADKQKREEEKAAFESLQRENAELKASKLLLESGRRATGVRMKALANCATEAEQQELLESWPKAEENGRPASSPGLIESVGDFPRDNPEKFAALLR